MRSEQGSGTETRLETHRTQFIANEGRGPMLRIEELTADEIGLVNVDFLARCQGKQEDIDQIYLAYVETLHSWGLMCPHPQPHRLYQGWQRSDVPVSRDDAAWYSCKLCQALVINI